MRILKENMSKLQSPAGGGAGGGSISSIILSIAIMTPSIFVNTSSFNLYN
jgi:hypothetical protein